MTVNLGYDIAEKSKLDFIGDKFEETTYEGVEMKEYFGNKKYGDDIQKIIIGILCLNRDLEFKPRIRHYKKENLLVLDIIFIEEDFLKLKMPERKHEFVTRLLNDLPIIFEKYKKLDFDSKKFMEDFTAFALNTGFLLEK